MTKFYTGVGSRETPLELKEFIFSIVKKLAESGWTLRTGGATGADSFFLESAQISSSPFELYLPWPGYNGHKTATLLRPAPKSFTKTAPHHPAWAHLKPAVRQLHARNAHCVLGSDCTLPSSFILCWTKDAKGEGGTGQAIRIAKAYSIPIFDSADPLSFERLQKFVDSEIEPEITKQI